MENKQPDEKAIERWLKSMSAAIEAEEIESISNLLAEANEPILNSFRESKLIARSSSSIRSELLRELVRAAERHLPSEGTEFKAYLRFFEAVERELIELRGQMAEEIREIPLCSIGDLLSCASVVFHLCLTSLKVGEGGIPIDVTVAERERWVHHTNGDAVDIVNAVARAINECARVRLIKNARALNKGEYRNAILHLLEVVQIASQVNSLEWLFDCISYGEFAVDEYSEEPAATFKFKFLDPRRSFLRALGIRRNLILALKPNRTPRAVRDILLGGLENTLNSATTLYLQAAGLPKKTEVDQSYANAILVMELMRMDAEDDLLAAASKESFEKVLTYYLIAMTLQCYASAAETVRAVAPKSRNRILNPPRIPVDFAVRGMDLADSDRVVASALGALTSELPVRSHSMLVSRPFIRDGNCIRPFLDGHGGSWTVVVREALIKGGAVGKSVGAIWERFFAESFENSDWRIIGQGIKLKKDKKYLTDIDLLLVREDLLLVVQIKALIGSGQTTHDHWKNKKTIELGCRQALTATQFLEADRSSLISICGRRTAESIRKIQPVVLTNEDLYNGWEYAGVPVMGEVTRKAICEGSKVEYYNAKNGDVMHTQVFSERGDLTTELIIEMLTHPVEEKISAEGDKIEYRSQNLGRINVSVPEFAVREDLSDFYSDQFINKLSAEE